MNRHNLVIYGNGATSSVALHPAAVRASLHLNRDAARAASEPARTAEPSRQHGLDRAGDLVAAGGDTSEHRAGAAPVARLPTQALVGDHFPAWNRPVVQTLLTFTGLCVVAATVLFATMAGRPRDPAWASGPRRQEAPGTGRAAHLNRCGTRRPTRDQSSTLLAAASSRSTVSRLSRAAVNVEICCVARASASSSAAPARSAVRSSAT